MEDTIRFLGRILPPAPATYFAVIKSRASGDNAWTRHSPYTSVELLAEYLLAEDRRNQVVGNHVFYACAAYQQPSLTVGDKKRYRVDENVLSAKAFWLDIDVGPSKPYETREDALSALQKFCTSTELPFPNIIVGSGPLGLHVYWVLSEPILKTQWKPMMAVLKRLVIATDFKIDTSRSDITSILRPVGTHNYKSLEAPTLVEELHDDGGEIDPSELTSLLGAAAQKFHASLPPTSTGGSARNANSDLGINDHDPFSAAEAAEKCAQLRLMRDTKGNIPEPLWYALLGVLAFAEDGEALAQEWSSGHPTYSASATTTKLEQAREAQSGVTSCGRLELLNPTLCAGCAYKGKINTPRGLGFVTTGSFETIAQTAAAKGEQSAILDLLTQCYPVPKEYKLSPVKDGIWVEKRDENGAVIPDRVCAYTLGILEYYEVQEDSRHLFRLAYRIGKTSGDILMAAKIGPTFFQDLGEKGVHIPKSEEAKMNQFFTKYLQEVALAGQKQRSYSTMGWKSDFNEFALGSKLYARDGSIRPFSPPKSSRYITDHLVTKGDKQHWIEGANLFNPPDLEGRDEAEQRMFLSYQIAVCASFGAPFMALLNQPGAVINLYSRAGGVGKTAALRLAAAIWGAPHGLLRRGDDTLHAKTGRLSIMRHLPVMIDEVTDTMPTYGPFAMTVTHGSAKETAFRLGGKVDESAAEGWATFVLTTSNVSVTDYLQSGGEGADFGTQAKGRRVLEFCIDVSKRLYDPGQGRLLERAISQNYGVVGKEFITNLMQQVSLADLDNAVAKALDYIRSRLSSSNTTDVWVNAATAIFLGGTYANHWGFINYDLDKLLGFLLDELRETEEETEHAAEGPLSELSILLSKLQAQTNHIDKNGRPLVAREDLSSKEIAVRYDEHKGKIFIRSASFTEMCRIMRVNRRELLRWMRIEQLTEGDLKVARLDTGYKKYNGYEHADLSSEIEATAAPAKCVVISLKRYNALRTSSGLPPTAPPPNNVKPITSKGTKI